MTTARAQLTPEQREAVLIDVYEIAVKVRSDCPFDGRTQAGRAWRESAWLVYRALQAELEPLS